MGFPSMLLGIGNDGAVIRIRCRSGRSVDTRGRCGVGESGKRSGRLSRTSAWGGGQRPEGAMGQPRSDLASTGISSRVCSRNCLDKVLRRPRTSRCGALYSHRRTDTHAFGMPKLRPESGDVLPHERVSPCHSTNQSRFPWDALLARCPSRLGWTVYLHLQRPRDHLAGGAEEDPRWRSTRQVFLLRSRRPCLRRRYSRFARGYSRSLRLLGLLACGAGILAGARRGRYSRFARGVLAWGAGILADARRDRYSRAPYGALDGSLPAALILSLCSRDPRFARGILAPSDRSTHHSFPLGPRLGLDRDPDQELRTLGHDGQRHVARKRRKRGCATENDGEQG